jgi:hypothetical protein
MTIPVGSPSTAKVFWKVIWPPDLLSSATPLSDFGFAVVTETKSQQPSLVEIVLNGWPGSGTYEIGEGAGALHLEVDAVVFCSWPEIDDERNKTNITAKYKNAVG